MTHARHVFSLLILALMLGACAQLGYAPAQTFKDKVAYTSAGIGAAADTLAGLTCDKYLPTGDCASPGRPFHPAVSQGHNENLGRANQAARAAGAMPATGGVCLGQPSTPAACLKVAELILDQVRLILQQFAKKGG